MDSVNRLAWSRSRCIPELASELQSVKGRTLTHASEEGVLKARRHTLSAALASVLAIAPSLVLTVALLPVDDAHASTFTVTTSAPSGVGSLSSAIAAANATPGANVIAFANGVTSIGANATVPAITNSVTFSSFTNLSIAATLSGNTSVTWGGGGTYALTGDNLNFTDGTTINGSVLQFGNGTSSADLSGATGAAGTVGSPSGTGGTAVTVNDGAFINSASSSVSGGNGGEGSSAGVRGGVGGNAISITSGSVINNGGITGGNGGNGGGDAISITSGSVINNGCVTGGNGYTNNTEYFNFAGIGGQGISMTTAGNLTNNGSINGGNGGGGNWGGIAVNMKSGGSFVNNGSVTGGNAGEAVSTPFRTFVGVGGYGLYLTGVSVINNGNITGGNGTPLASGGVEGSGANAIIASSTIVNGVLVGTTIINNGDISSGLWGDGVTRADAIYLIGGGNTLVIEAGSSITGRVVGTQGDTFALGGAVNSSFDVSRIGNAAQYVGLGAYEKTGTSVWVLTGTTTAVTPWVISQGTLSISSDANLGASAGSLTLAGGTLQTTADVASNRAVMLGNNSGTFDTDGHTLTLNGVVSGVGSLTKTDTGSLVLNGANTYTGGTTVSDGTLEVGDSSHSSASIQGAVTIDPNGSLRGHGTIDGDVTSDGMVWPGGSPFGTLVINGNYTQHADGILQIDVTPTQASQLVVTGNANLAGSLNLIFAPGTYSSTTYTLIKAGSLTGNFAAINAVGAAAALISPQMDFTNTQANLVLTKLSIAPVDGSLYGNLLRSANLVGQQTSSSVLDAALLDTATCDESEQAREPNVTQQACRGGVWVRATGSSLSLDGSNGLNATGFGLLGGADREVGDVHLGVEAGVNRVNANDPLGGYGDINIAHAGLYGFTHVGPLTLSANVDGAYDAYRVDRETGIGHTFADPAGHSVSGGLQAAWPLQFSAWQLTPKFGVLYQHQQMDGFTETLASNNPLASAYALHGERSTYTSLQPYLALSVTRNFTFQGITYVPALSIGYRYNTRSDNLPTVSTIAQDGTRFAPTAAPQGNGLATVGARITAEAGVSWNFYLDYQGLFASRLHDNALALGFVKHF